MQQALLRRPLCRCSPLWPLVLRSFARIAPELDTLESDDQMREAIRWSSQLAASDPTVIAKQDYALSYARSGGKGGQNVNKVETKAVLRFPLEPVTWLPGYVKARLRKHHSYAASSDALVMSSSTDRHRAANVQDVIRKLHATIVEAATSDLREPKSAAQLAREAAQQARAKERTLEDKRRRSRAQRDRMSYKGGL